MRSEHHPSLRSVSVLHLDERFVHTATSRVVYRQRRLLLTSDAQVQYCDANVCRIIFTGMPG